MKLNGALWIGFLPCFLVILPGAASVDVNFHKPVPARNSFSARNTCPPGFVEVDLHCYYFSEEVFNNWDDALHECHRHNENAFLVQIENEKEWKSIKLHLSEKDLDDKNWWIGLSDRQSDTEWEWVASNRPLLDSFWCKSSPNKEKHDSCAYILQGTDKENKKGLCWKNCHCTNPPPKLKLYFICEHD